MTRELLESFDGQGDTIFFLLDPTLDPARIGKELIEAIDDENGVQARISVDAIDESESWPDVILKEAKVKSRWGKDLEKYYREYLTHVSDKIASEADPVGYVTEEYESYNADAYESGAIGEELSLGIGIEEEIRKIVDEWGSQEISYTMADLRAAIGYAMETLDYEEISAKGYLVFEFEDGLPSQTKRVAGLGEAIHEFQLMGLNVAIVLHDEHDIRDQIRRRFRTLGKFEFEEVGDTPIDEETVREVENWLNEWYQDLCYEVESSQIRGEVAAKAGVVATQLRRSTMGSVFADAIEYGLLRNYSHNKLDNRHGDEFEELWKKRVTGREGYDRYNSKRADFPRVTVARSDGLKRDFELRIGPGGRVDINGISISGNENPAEVLIEKIVDFIEAKRLSEEEWEEIVESYSEILDYGSNEVAGNLSWALLSVGLVPPESDAMGGVDDLGNDADLDIDWFDKYWKGILSTYKMSTLSARGVIREKKELKKDLSLKYPSEVFLFQKVERDLQNAREYFREEIETRVSRIIPDELNYEVGTDTEEIDKVWFSIGRDQQETLECTVTIEIPYREVKIDGRRLDSPNISNVVQEVINRLDLLRIFTDSTVAFDRKSVSETMYELLRLYVRLTNAAPGDLVHFDDFAAFCSQVPAIADWAHSSDSTVSVEKFLLEKLSTNEFVERLREQNVTFHRKGNDPRSPIRVESGNKYIAFEMSKPLD